MAPKPRGRLGSALLPIGAVAVVAGCAGGSVNSSGAYTPPVTAAGSVNRPMTTAQVTLQFGTSSSSSGRQAMALNSTVRQIGIRFIPLPAPSVTPTEQIFTLPQPAPASTTLTVTAPVGQNQFILGAYEPPPACLASAVQQPASGNRRTAAVRPPLALPTLVPINGSVQTVTLSSNGANSINAPVGPVAFGASVAVTPQPTLGAGYLGTTQWSPLENLSTTQNVGMAVTPVNVCGAQMSGSVVNAVVVSGPGGVAFSSSTFSAPGSTTATYGANANSGGTISAAATLPANTAPQNAAQSVSIVPDYFIFALDSTGSYLDVLDGQTGQNLAGGGAMLSHSRTPFGSARQPRARTRSAQGVGVGGVQAVAAVNASACTGGTAAAAFAAAGSLSSGPGIDVFTVSPSGVVSGPTFIAWTAGGYPTAVAFDSSCRLYAGDYNGYLGVAALGGSISPVPTAADLGFSGLVAGAASMYASYSVSAGNAMVATFPFGGTTLTPTGFSVPTSTYYLDALALAGGNVYVALLPISGCFEDFRALSGASVGISTVSGTCCPNVSQFAGTATGSTLYAVSRTGYLYSVAGGNVTPMMSAPNNGGSISGVALSQDSPTSTLWLSGAGVPMIYQFSLPALTPTGAQYSVPFPMSSNPAGPLSIAP